jgi:hypothetical protein
VEHRDRERKSHDVILEWVGSIETHFFVAGMYLPPSSHELRGSIILNTVLVLLFVKKRLPNIVVEQESEEIASCFSSACSMKISEDEGEETKLPFPETYPVFRDALKVVYHNM